MQKIERIVIKGEYSRDILADITFNSYVENQPVLIFCHGFKGYKDWGHFNLMTNYLVQQGVAILKFNFSHNGGTIDDPIDFPDLEAFGNNNYAIELSDLQNVINWLFDNAENTLYKLFYECIDLNQVSLLGHSRGGGIVVIKAHEDERISSVITLAGVGDYLTRLPKDLRTWQQDGVLYIMNGRTKQNMPMYYQFAETLLNNKERLTIINTTKQLKKPYLIIHGTNDEAVAIYDAELLHNNCSVSKLFVIEGANHTFGGKHPYTDRVLPEDSLIALDKIVEFILDKN